MNLCKVLAQQFREVHFGGNWTASDLTAQLSGLSWQQATTKIGSCNTIAALVYHTNYFVQAVLQVLRGGVLDAHDKYSFDHPTVNTQVAWENLVRKTLDDAGSFAELVEQLPEHTLWENFTDEKYGTYYRNIQGIIEHTHYHLGQVALVKKLVLSGMGNTASKG